MEHPLRLFRRTKAISMGEAATALGVSKATLSRVETGKQQLSSGLLRRIAKWSNGAVTPNDMLGIKVGGRSA